MKLKYLLLASTVLIFLTVLTFPMRGVVLFIPKDNISVLGSSGFWWSGQIDSLKIDEQNLGMVSLELDLLGLLSQKIKFKVHQNNTILISSGYLSRSFSYWELEDVKFKLDFTQSSLQSLIYSSEGYIEKLVFNNTGCVEARGKISAKVSDIFGLFSRELLLSSNLTCKEDSIYGIFQAKDKEALNGYFSLDVNHHYKMEAYSQKLDSKLSELRKLKFNLQPSIKAEGSLSELVSSLIQ